MKGALIGRGRTAEVFAWDDDRALKLYYAAWPASAAEQEAHIARGVYAAGLLAIGRISTGRRVPSDV